MRRFNHNQVLYNGHIWTGHTYTTDTAYYWKLVIINCKDTICINIFNYNGLIVETPPVS